MWWDPRYQLTPFPQGIGQKVRFLFTRFLFTSLPDQPLYPGYQGDNHYTHNTKETTTRGHFKIFNIKEKENTDVVG